MIRGICIIGLAAVCLGINTGLRIAEPECNTGHGVCGLGRHWQQCGDPEKCEYQPGRCGRDNVDYAGVRCCSDVPMGGYRYQDKCNLYVLSKFGENGKCYEKRTFEQAALLCATTGGRLCTMEELENGCTAQEGCTLDRKLIWSAERTCNCNHGNGGCPPGAFFADCGMKRLCEGKRPGRCLREGVEYAGVRCCSDVAVRGFFFHPKCQLYVKTKFGPDNKRCFEKTTWAEANEICTESGGRLCTKEEMLGECHRAMDCNLGNRYIWSGEQECGRAIIPEIVQQLTLEELEREFSIADMARAEQMELEPEQMELEPESAPLMMDEDDGESEGFDQQDENLIGRLVAQLNAEQERTEAVLGCDGSFEYGVRSPGNDIRGTPTETPEECRDLCQATQGCMAFTWAEDKQNSCHLKTSLANRYKQSGFVSGTKNACNDCEGSFEYGVRSPGNDIRGFPTKTPRECRDQCQATQGCKAFTWRVGEGNSCHLKTSLGNKYRQPGFVSGTMNACNGEVSAEQVGLPARLD